MNALTKPPLPLRERAGGQGGLRVEEAGAVYAVEQHALLKSFDLLATAPDGVARLRELILSLAVQGKLVPQDPADEPASVLLARIHTEKQALIKAGKLKKDKPLAEVAEEEKPFELPDSWEWTRLGGLGQIIGGGTPKSDDPALWAESGVPWLTPADLYGRKEKLISSGRRDISEEGLNSSSAQLLPVGTVLFSSRAPIGYVAIAANALATNQGFKSCVPHLDGFSNYLFWFLKKEAKSIDAKASGTTFKEISGGEFAKVVVPVPPLAERSRIVARVEELMQLCDALEQQGKLEAAQHARLVGTLFDALANSESAHALAENWQRVEASFGLLLDRPEAVDALEQTLLQLAVRGLLVPQDPKDEPASELLKRIRTEKDHLIATGKLKRDKPLPEISEEEKPFELPKGWAWARLSALAGFENGDRGSNYPSKSAFVNDGVRFINAGHLVSQQIDRAEMNFITEQRFNSLRSGKVQRNDILYCLRGSLGKLALVADDDLGAIASSLVIVRVVPGFDVLYAMLYFSAPLAQLLIRRFDNGTAQPNLGANDLAKFIVPLPPLAEQSRIVARVAELRQLCADLRARLSAARSTQTRLAEALVEQAA